MVQLATDNTTALYYVNKQGVTHSPSLLYLAVNLWEWCYSNHIFTIAVHISTDDNFLADDLSRLPTRTHKWSLNNAVFRQLCQWWSTPSIDLFASAANSKCKQFCSQAGIDNTSLGDAFMIDWSYDFLYLFPPLPLIQRVIIFFRQDRANAILIAPYWPRQPWFAHLVAMSMDMFRLLSIQISSRLTKS